MKKYIFYYLFSGLFFSANGQAALQKRFPVGCFHRHNLEITGISYGAWSYTETPRNTTTRGLRLELLGFGVFAPVFLMAPPVDDDQAFDTLMKTPLSEKVKGINISGTGSTGDFKVSGISIGGVGQVITAVNGIAIAGLINEIQEVNGLQLALLNNSGYNMHGLEVGLTNYTVRLKGVQIGLLNSCKHSRGIQLGIWNKNERRKFPLLNWNFRHK